VAEEHEVRETVRRERVTVEDAQTDSDVISELDGR
jgi:hypothetical protein